MKVNLENSQKNQQQSALNGIKAARLVTRLSLLVERIWPIFLPAVLVALLFAAVSWFGVFRLVSDEIRYAIAAVFALALVGCASGILGFRLPGMRNIDRRLEERNRLEHTPVSAQTDQISGQKDAFSEALWREHQKRLAASLNNLEPDLPRTGIPARDPYGLRSAVVLTAVIAFAFSLSPSGGRLTDAFNSHEQLVVIPPRVDAWATPPVYTSRAPIFLTAKGNAEQAEFSVPEGSVITVRVSGGSGAEELAFIAADQSKALIEPKNPRPEPNSDAARAAPLQFEYVLADDGSIELSNHAGTVDSWAFSTIPDNAPTIKFNGDPKRALNGTLELSYIIEDDYGVASAETVFEPVGDAKQAERPLYGPPEMGLSLPRRGARISEARTMRDLTEHPWAGSSVEITLIAKDDAGQEGRSETRKLILPERTFTNPLAKAVIEQRRILALDGADRDWVLTLMDAITLRPDDTIPNKQHYLGLVSAMTRLEMAHTDDELRAVVDYLWEVARGIEDGDLSAAERRLRDAQEALKQALENGASDEEIDRLMAELREAMQEFLRELAERAMENPEMAQPVNPNGQELRQSDLDRLMDQIEQLAKSGARDQAQELLSQLQNMMNNLQAGRHQQQQGDSQQNQMREQMNQLGEMMRRQQELMNETFRQQQRQRRRGNQQGQQQGNQQGQNQQGQNPGNQPGQGGMSAEEFAEALRQLQEGQGQLRGQLGEFMEQLEGMGIEPGQEFGDAGESMGRAGDALGRSETGEAVGEQGEALEALRRGAQSMMQQMQQQMQGQNGGSEDDGTLNRRANRDPLGRPRATTGPDFGDGVEVPDEIDTQRARRILEAIRKRLGDSLSPQVEKDYLERLLQMR